MVHVGCLPHTFSNPSPFCGSAADVKNHSSTSGSSEKARARADLFKRGHNYVSFFVDLEENRLLFGT
jgi:hypothetical protein